MKKKNSSEKKPFVLQTHHIFLDTQVYRSLGHNPNSPPLLELKNYISENRLSLHITDINLGEIKKQIHEYVSEAELALNKAKKHYGRWKSRLPKVLKENIPEFNTNDVAKSAWKNFTKTAKDEWEIRVHQSTDFSAKEIFSKYFQQKPPFQSANSKEFPDAFIVYSLDEWCRTHKEKMYVVSSDKAFLDAVKECETLLPLENLSELLQSITTIDSPDVINEARELLKSTKLQSSLSSTIHDHSNEIIPIYAGDQLTDGEVSDHTVNGDPKIKNFKVISSSNDELGLIIHVNIPLNIEINFLDLSEAFYDKEDDEYIGAEFDSSEIEHTPTLRAYIKVNKKEGKILNFEFITNEFNFYDEDEHEFLK